MFFKLTSILVFLALNVLGLFTVPASAEFHQVTALPQDTPTCEENDNIDDCIRSSLQQMLKRSKNGVPELNIPPIDPLLQERTNLQFQNNLIQGKVAVRKLKIVGLSDSIVDKTSFKRDGNHITFTAQTRTPKLQVDGQYKAEVVVNNAKMHSKGVFNVTMLKIEAKAMAEAELYERDGHTYMRVTSFNVDPTLGNMKIFATGLMPDPALNDALLQFINNEWRQLYKTAIAEARSTWEPMLIQHANEFFSNLPFDLIYLTKSS